MQHIEVVHRIEPGRIVLHILLHSINILLFIGGKKLGVAGKCFLSVFYINLHHTEFLKTASWNATFS